MVQIYWADERDFLIDHRDFEDTDFTNMLKYIKTGLEGTGVKIIKVRKWDKRNDSKRIKE